MAEGTLIPRPEMEPMSPEVESRVLTVGLPGKYCAFNIVVFFLLGSLLLFSTCYSHPPSTVHTLTHIEQVFSIFFSMLNHVYITCTDICIHIYVHKYINTQAFFSLFFRNEILPMWCQIYVSWVIPPNTDLSVVVYFVDEITTLTSEWLSYAGGLI